MCSEHATQSYPSVSASCTTRTTSSTPAVTSHSGAVEARVHVEDGCDDAESERHPGNVSVDGEPCIGRAGPSPDPAATLPPTYVTRVDELCPIFRLGTPRHSGVSYTEAIMTEQNALQVRQGCRTGAARSRQGRALPCPRYGSAGTPSSASGRWPRRRRKTLTSPTSKSRFHRGAALFIRERARTGEGSTRHDHERDREFRGKEPP